MTSLTTQDELLRHIRQKRKEAFLFPLGDEQRVLLGPVLPEDRDRIRVGVTRLSSISRYLRFFTATATLNEDQLRYLTEVDQVNHVAWCAVDVSTPALDGLGLGRFIRLNDRPEIAELALAVIDAYQGRGLGRILLALLYLRAREVGVRTLRALILPENHAVQCWFRNLGASIRFAPDLIQADLPVYPDPADLPQTPTADRFRQALTRLAQAKIQS